MQENERRQYESARRMNDKAIREEERQKLFLHWLEQSGINFKDRSYDTLDIQTIRKCTDTLLDGMDKREQIGFLLRLGPVDKLFRVLERNHPEILFHLYRKINLNHLIAAVNGEEIMLN